MDMLPKQIVRKYKVANIKPQQARLLSTVFSTNSYCKSVQGKDSFFVWSRKQSKGRGQQANTWIDFGPSNVYLSLSLRPGAELFHLIMSSSSQNDFSIPLLTILTGEAIRNALKRFTNKTLYIKWPNDILYYDRGNWYKICGILLESSIQGKNIEHLIIGSGINLSSGNYIHSDSKLVPDRMGQTRLAGFLRDIGAKGISKGKVLRSVLKNIEFLLNEYYRSDRDYREKILMEIYGNGLLNESMLPMEERDWITRTF